MPREPQVYAQLNVSISPELSKYINSEANRRGVGKRIIIEEAMRLYSLQVVAPAPEVNTLASTKA